MLDLVRKLFAVMFMLLSSYSIGQVAQPPYTVSLQDVTYPDWPGLQSVALGQWDGRWIMLSGRTGGLHGFIPPGTFSTTEANDQLWLFDPETGQQWHSNIYSLPAGIAAQVRSTSTEFFQRNQYLYIFGGYGKDTVTDQFITFPSMIAVNLSTLTTSILSDTDPSSSFRKFDDSLFCVTGGEIEVMDNRVYLFGGHIFTGEYSDPPSPLFHQQYTNKLVTFNLDDDGTMVTVSDITSITDSINFHRRDLNFQPLISPGEVEGLAVLSGVFQYDQKVPYQNPVYITDAGYVVDTSFHQKFNNYTCPILSFFDSVSQNYFATLFGGISQFYFNTTDSVVKEDLNIPFVKDFSTIIKHADGSTEQVLLPNSFDDLLGTNAVFILNDALPHYNNGVIKLHDIDGDDILAGYIFGGIDATFPNLSPSTASNRLFKVVITYHKPIPEALLADNILKVKIYPNPVHDVLKIKNLSSSIEYIEVVNATGDIINREHVYINYGDEFLLNTAQYIPGIYFIKLISGSSTGVFKILKY